MTRDVTIKLMTMTFWLASKDRSIYHLFDQESKKYNSKIQKKSPPSSWLNKSRVICNMPFGQIPHLDKMKIHQYLFHLRNFYFLMFLRFLNGTCIYPPITFNQVCTYGVLGGIMWLTLFFTTLIHLFHTMKHDILWSALSLLIVPCPDILLDN